MTNRITVSLDDEAQGALDELVGEAEKPQSELVRQALVFYAANYDAATAEAGSNLEAYHQMLSSGEHVLLDVDFLHCFLDYVEDETGTPTRISSNWRTKCRDTTPASTNTASIPSANSSIGSRSAAF